MKPKYRPVALDEKARDYLQTRQESPRTQETARMALQAFYAFRRTYKKRETDEAPAPLALPKMDFDVLVEFNNWMQRKGYSAFSRDGYIAQVGTFLGYAQDKDWTGATFSVERAKRQRRQTRQRRSYPIPKTNPLFPRVLTYYDDLPLPNGDDDHANHQRLDILRGRALLQTLYASAGRATEVAHLTRKQIQDGRRGETEIVGKGAKERFLYFTPEAQSALAAYLTARQDESPYVFINHKREYGKQLSRQMLWHIVKLAAEKVGAEDIHPHDFRHYRARQMLEHGARLEEIQEILGHEDIGTTRKVYAHFDHKTTREIFDRTIVSTRDAQSE